MTNIKKLTKPTLSKTLTVWDDPKSKVLSQWGHITYLEWCHNESRRMNACGGNTLVCEEPEGKVAICRP